MKLLRIRCCSFLLVQALLAGAASAQFLEVAAGLDHSLALRCDGAVVAWGNNDVGQCDVPALPPGLTYVEISAGGARENGDVQVSYGLSLARRSDGSVVAWGDNSHGQLDVPPLPSGLTYVEVAAGPNHCLARRSDGSVAAWGDNAYGQCDVPALPPGLSYVEISAGGWMEEHYDLSDPLFHDYDSYHPSHSVARRSDGSVVAWATNFNGLDKVPSLPPGLTYVEVSAGSDHTAARLSDGSAVAWGGNAFGQTDVPPLPPGLTYVEISAGGAHTAARLSDGSVVSWGNSSSAWWWVPEPPAGPTYVAIATGGAFVSRWVIPQFGSPYSEIDASHHILALRRDGSLAGWGANDMRQARVPAGWKFEDLGQGLAGIHGVPVLAGALDCPTGQDQPVTLTLERARAKSPFILVIGRQRIDLPRLGGTLVPSPDQVLRGRTGPTGTVSTSREMQSGVPSGLTVYFQYWVLDPAATSGWSASNALSLMAP